MGKGCFLGEDRGETLVLDEVSENTEAVKNYYRPP